MLVFFSFLFLLRFLELGQSVAQNKTTVWFTE